MTRYLIREIPLNVGVPETELSKAIGKLLRIAEKNISHIKVVRKSLDARKRNRPVWKFALEFSCSIPLKHPRVKLVLEGVSNPNNFLRQSFSGPKVAVVGCGPAGLSAALGLARKGYAVTVFEQGKPVGPRFRDIRLFIKQNQLDPHSNVLFGEGGAGTFSDGKLTARTRNHYTDEFLREMVACGADESILTYHHPHLGTDKLQFYIEAFRKRCEATGVVFRFETEVIDLIVEQGKCLGLKTNTTRESFDAVVLAPGLWAYRMYEVLARSDVALERKDFSVGVRIEHPQEFINRCRLGDKVNLKSVGAAEYFLTWNGATSSVYSFCMCPGGVVIPCATQMDGLSTNGMSYSNRASPFANAAIVVTIQSKSLPGGILAGLEYQRHLETTAFQMGGSDFTFPGQTATAFIEKRLDSESLPKSSFQKHLRACNLWDLFEPSVSQAMSDALQSFDQKMPGFIRHGLLIAPESRTSSPIRISRDHKTLQSTNTSGLFPIGEGAGFSGGIVSSGADGFRLAAEVEIWKKD